MKLARSRLTATLGECSRSAAHPRPILPSPSRRPLSTSRPILASLDPSSPSSDQSFDQPPLSAYETRAGPKPTRPSPSQPLRSSALKPTATDEPPLTLSISKQLLAQVLRQPPPPHYVGPFHAQPILTRLSKALSILSALKSANITPTTEIYSMMITACWLALQDRIALNGGSEIDGRALKGDKSMLAKVQNVFRAERWEDREKEMEGKERGRGKGLEGKGAEPAKGWGSLEWEVAWGCYVDAREAGVEINRESLNVLMMISMIHNDLSTHVHTLLTHPDSAPDLISFQLALTPHLRLDGRNSNEIHLAEGRTLRDTVFDDLDRIIYLYAEFRSMEIEPTEWIVQGMVIRLLGKRYYGAALDVLADFEGATGRMVSEGTLRTVMVHLTRYCPGSTLALRTLYDYVVVPGHFTPDLGLYLEMIHKIDFSIDPSFWQEIYSKLSSHTSLPSTTSSSSSPPSISSPSPSTSSTASRTSPSPPTTSLDPTIAGHLQALSYRVQITYFFQLNDRKSAFQLLSIMRQQGFEHDEALVEDVADLIVGEEMLEKLRRAQRAAPAWEVGRSWALDAEDQEALRKRCDEAWYDLLEVKEEYGVADVSAANAIIRACAMIPDVPRVVDTFNAISSDLSLRPDIESYHQVLLSFQHIDTDAYYRALIPQLESSSLLQTPSIYEARILFLTKFPSSLPEATALLRTAATTLAAQSSEHGPTGDATRPTKSSYWEVYWATLKWENEQVIKDEQAWIEKMAGQGHGGDAHPFSQAIRAEMNSKGYPSPSEMDATRRGGGVSESPRLANIPPSSVSRSLFS